MKIVIFGGIFGGGAERQVCNLANHLATKHEVTIATFSKDTKTYPLDSKVKISRMGKVPLEVPLIRKFFKWRNLYTELKKEGIDIYISFSASMNYMVLQLNRITRKKIIVSERTAFNRYIDKTVDYARKVLYKKAQCVVFLTKADFDGTQFLPNRTYIYNPIEIKPFNNYDNREKRILAVGGLARWKVKGFDLLLKAWSKIYKDFPEWKLEIAGKVNDDTIQKMIRALGMDNAVALLGHIDNLPELMQRKSVYVLSSRNEGFPNSLAEAMSQGCACIAYDCETGPNEIIEDKINGILVSNGDVDHLATAIQNLIKDEELRRKLSSEAIKIVKKFEPTAILTEWETLILNCVNEENVWINRGRNLTPPMQNLVNQGLRIGKGSVVLTENFPKEIYLITIGSYVKIAPNVSFQTQFPVWSLRYLKNDPGLDCYGKISVGDYTHIESNVIIYPGVKIGSNCIIKSGSVVSQSIPNGWVVEGNPIRYVCLTEEYYNNIKQKPKLNIGRLNPRDKRDFLESLAEEDFIPPNYLDK